MLNNRKLTTLICTIRILLSLLTVCAGLCVDYNHPEEILKNNRSMVLKGKMGIKTGSWR